MEEIIKELNEIKKQNKEILDEVEAIHSLIVRLNEKEIDDL